MKISEVFEEKHNGKYIETWRTEDKTRVFEDLSRNLISKKLCECTWIRSIKRTQLYNGFIKITVSEDNNCRRIYYIPEH